MPWNVWSLTGNRWMMMRSVASKKLAAKAIDQLFKRDYPKDKFEVRLVMPHLELHGTTLIQFKPEAIWRMAMRDLDARSVNATAVVGKMRHYHFHRDHIRKASSANDILRAAIQDPARGRESSKKLTRLLYADVEQLKAALR